MFRYQTKRWSFALVLAGIVFCIMIGYMLDVQHSQARSVKADIVATAPTVPTIPTAPTEVPTGVPTVPPVPTEVPTGVPTVPPVPTEVPTGVPTVPPPAADVILISSSTSGKVQGIKYRDEDILAYAPATATWIVVVDGSDLGLRHLDLTDFYVMSDGSILMSFNRSFTLPGVGRVNDSDIIRFMPTQLGSDTKGTFAWYLDGSDVGLNKGSGDIDAIAFAPDGSLVVSTKGTVRIGDFKSRDEDLLVLRNGEFGEESKGTWELYFDGSDLKLTKGSEDIDALWIDQQNGNLYLATRGDFHVEGQEDSLAAASNSLQGDSNDIFICIPVTLGDETDCVFQTFFDGETVGLTKRINGLSVNSTTVFGATWPTTPTIDNDDGDEDAQYPLLEDDEIGAAAMDEEMDVYDQEVEEVEDVMNPQVIFLPVIKQ